MSPNARTFFFLAFMGFASYSEQGWCELGSIQDDPGFENLTAVDNGTLEKMRGGYESPQGVHFDIGIGKAMYIGGILQVQSSTEANNLHFNGAAISAVNVQNLSSELKTTIQNNMDNRIIQNFNVIDVNVRNFGGFMETMKNLQDLGSVQAVQVLK